MSVNEVFSTAGVLVASTTSAEIPVPVPVPVPVAVSVLNPTPSSIFLPLRLSVFLFSFTVSSAFIDFKIEVNELISLAFASTSFWVVSKDSKNCLASEANFSAFEIWATCFAFPWIRSIWDSKPANFSFKEERLRDGFSSLLREVSFTSLFSIEWDTSALVSSLVSTSWTVDGFTSSLFSASWGLVDSSVAGVTVCFSSALIGAVPVTVSLSTEACVSSLTGDTSSFSDSNWFDVCAGATSAVSVFCSLCVSAAATAPVPRNIKPAAIATDAAPKLYLRIP